MKHIFITYGDTGFESAKAKIVKEARSIKVFDEIFSYDRADLSPELLASDIINIKRGGGLWSWKPDVILSTMEHADEGDIIVYCDAGCSLYQSREWKSYWKKLENHDIISQRIFKRTDQWTRKEIIEYFIGNGSSWLKCFQYQATPIFKVSEFSKTFVKEWRDIMIEHPNFAMDVTEEEKNSQNEGFIENRHDQAIYSALVYKYLSIPACKDKIFTQWEHIEDLDPFCKQAIRATRLRQGQDEAAKQKAIKVLKRIIKDFIFKPFYYTPIQWWNSR